MSKELKPLSRKQIEEVFVAERPILMQNDGVFELDIQRTVTAIYEALPNKSEEIARLTAEVEKAVEEIKRLVAMNDRMLENERSIINKLADSVADVARLRELGAEVMTVLFGATWAEEGRSTEFAPTFKKLAEALATRQEEENHV